jgi:hypothetical protein
MTRNDLVKMRDETFAELRELGSAVIRGAKVEPEKVKRFTILVMLHGVLCAQLKAWEDSASHASAVCRLDESLGLITDVSSGSAKVNDVVTELRLKIHSALAILES